VSRTVAQLSRNCSTRDDVSALLRNPVRADARDRALMREPETVTEELAGPVEEYLVSATPGSRD
jgi:hypothetical protein